MEMRRVKTLCFFFQNDIFYVGHTLEAHYVLSNWKYILFKLLET